MKNSIRKYGNPSSRLKRKLKARAAVPPDLQPPLTKERQAWLDAHNARVAKKFTMKMQDAAEILKLEDSQLPNLPSAVVDLKRQ